MSPFPTNFPKDSCGKAWALNDKLTKETFPKGKVFFNLLQIEKHMGAFDEILIIG